MNIFLQEFKMHLRSTILWILSILVLLLTFQALYPSFSGDSLALDMILENYPKELLDMFGMGTVDLSTIAGYFAMVFLFVQICAAIQASHHGFSILSMEERERTVDFLLAKPVRRSVIFQAKLSASLAHLLITNLCVWIGGFAVIELFKNGQGYDAGLIARMLISLLPFQLVFLSIGLSVSLIAGKIRNVLPYSVGLGIGLYVVSAFKSVMGVNVLSYLTPYKYFDPAMLVENGRFDPVLVAIGCGITLACTMTGYILYRDRDMRSAS